ncbi:MAG: DUF4160 domain-containing protein [candidate division NC10 bacterium]|nr:DUF4160 domain-containing protein [candidate division NC10 bacterium]
MLLNATNQRDPGAVFDCNEPPHVHVERGDRTCKFWLEKWDEHCG